MGSLDAVGAGAMMATRTANPDSAFHPVYPVHPGSKKIFSQDGQDELDK
jgi:hypothetical protein